MLAHDPSGVTKFREPERQSTAKFLDYIDLGIDITPRDSATWVDMYILPKIIASLQFLNIATMRLGTEYCIVPLVSFKM